MARPQPLGVLPTLWFWREVRAEQPGVGVFAGLFMGVFATVGGRVLLGAGVSLPVALVATLCLPLLGLGLIERWLRRRVIRRRRALARGESRGEPPRLGE